jgi:hypothetical protein
MKERYPSLESSSTWYISDTPSDIPLGATSEHEAQDNWYYGGGHLSTSPAMVPPAPPGTSNTDPMARVLLEFGRGDRDGICILSPLTSGHAWQIIFNLFFTGHTIVVGRTQPVDAPITIPVTEDTIITPELLKTSVQALVLNADTGALVPNGDSLLTLVSPPK